MWGVDRPRWKGRAGQGLHLMEDRLLLEESWCQVMEHLNARPETSTLISGSLCASLLWPGGRPQGAPCSFDGFSGSLLKKEVCVYLFNINMTQSHYTKFGKQNNPFLCLPVFCSHCCFDVFSVVSTSDRIVIWYSYNRAVSVLLPCVHN